MAFKLTTLALLALFFCSARAFSVLNVTDTFVEREIDVLPEENPEAIVDLNALSTADRSVQLETSDYFASSYRTGYARVTSTGITVQRGTSGYLNFRIKAVGIDSKTYFKRDESFSQYITKHLSEKYVNEYAALKKKYNGNLDLPIFEFLGFHLNKKFSAEAEKAKSRADLLTEKHYKELSSIAKTTLSDYTKTKTVIRGKLRAKGISLRPTSVQAYIKHSRVKLSETETTNIYTTLGKDLVAATSSGQPVPSDQQFIEIL